MESPARPRLQRPRRTARPLTAATAVAALLAACSPGNAAGGEAQPKRGDPEVQTPLVRVAPVEVRPVRRVIETTGYLESEHRVVVLPEVAGRVEQVLVDEGQHVDKGELLAQLDDREARASVRQVEVQLADRRVRLELAQVERDAAARRVEQARIERDKAQAQHQRNLEIDPGLISEKELEDSKFALDAAAEALGVAELQKRKAELEAEAAENTIHELEARLDAENIRLADHRIVAPIEGVVVERFVRGGEAVSTQTQLFVVVDQDDLLCYLRRPQRELPLIRDAKHVTFTTDAVPDREFVANIDVILPVVDQDTGSFRVRVRVGHGDDGAELLRPGMFVRARILTEEQRDAVMVPKAAVLNEGTQSIVFAVRDGVARRVVLVTGIEERDHVESLDRGEFGLAAGDQVVVSGQASLRDNTAVELAEE
ncbi:MAG: efflux RND transporter periplasmic adaptor subunit [Planctomycetes bacterium]|nr:efflux RND transporter periplasmic adaptor subunit [Planctomycetota bacterium]